MLQVFKTRTVKFYAAILSGVAFILMHQLVLFGYKIPDMFFLAWFYLVPLIVVIHQLNIKQKFILSLIAHAVGFWGLFYWLLSAMQQFGGMNIFQAFGLLFALVLVLSVLKSIFVVMASWVNIYNKLPLAILLPLFLCAHDIILHFYPWGGLPWGMPAYSQAAWIRFFQWIDFTGIMGLNIYIYAVNGLIADALIQIVTKRQIDNLMSRFIIIFVLAVLSFYLSFLSKQSFEHTKKSINQINVALVQGNIPQDQKWNFEKAKENLGRHLTQTKAAVKNGAQLVIWPETAYPYGIFLEDIDKERFLDQEKLPASLFLGAVTYENKNNSHMRNTVVHVDSSARYADLYHKMHLVPFGEYLPMKEYFNLDPLVHGIGEFTPGLSPSIFNESGIKFGNLICFEDVYPLISKINVLQGADVLINYTNDGWYGNTSAPYQHLVFSQFRALENRRFLLRATNTGVTAIIGPNGEVVAEYPPFKEGYLFHTLSVETGDAFYTRHSDNWQIFYVIFAGLIFTYTVVKRFTGPVKPQY